ncbi:MAG: hypothetical protein ACFBSF_08000 [Leptolyngbyaceae cyanobacterium]
MVFEKGVLSDESITLQELEQLKVDTFSEILPLLDKLVEYDLLQRMPTEGATEYAPMPLLTRQERDDHSNEETEQ